MDSQSSGSDEDEVDIGPDAPASPQDHTSADDGSSDPHAADYTSRQPSLISAQKRRRVTRACDECRRKKIKCDGKQPCTHCTIYSYDCTYDQPSHRKRNPAPQYTEALEGRLGRAEAVIRLYLPNFDWNDPSLDQMIQQQGPTSTPSRSQFGQKFNEKAAERKSTNDPTLETMIKATGQLDIDEKGNWDYHGGSSGLSFMRGMRDKLSDLKQPEQMKDRSQAQSQSLNGQIRVPSPPPFVGEQPGGIDLPFDAATFIGVGGLPGKDLARQLCISALEDATAILELVHQPSFYYRFNRIYDLPPESLDSDDQAFLPLLYAVIALGCLFATDSISDVELKGYRTAIGVGYKYFWACRQLVDITDCRDLTSLQAVVFMVMFLQCSAKLATCYSYIGIALRSALRMGLHRSFKDNFSPIEAEIRKRIFWVIRLMDIYVGAMLGLPQTLSDEDIDQDYPMEVDDDHVTSEGIVPMPEGSTALMAAANANFRLAKILCKIVRSIYPIKNYPNGEAGSSRAYSVSYAKIREIEMDLQRWQESLPSQLQPGGDGSIQNVRQQQLLRMAYAHAQMMLYRPFLHYVSARNQSKPVSQRAHACAAACISVSRNIIHITAEMKRRGLLEGSYWFTIYTTFFGVLSLTFFALENPDSPMCQEVTRDAKVGKETMERLARRSMAADRCTSTLNVLFEQIDHIFEKSSSPGATERRKGGPSSTNTRSSETGRNWPEFPREFSKGVSKSAASSGPPNSQRGNAVPRPRGMRLISQTGRPPSQKQQQQQQQQRQPRPTPAEQTTTHAPQQSHHFHQHHQQPLHLLHQPPGAPSSNPYLTHMAAESPTASSASSSFNTPISQGHYGQQQQYAFLPPPFQNAARSDNISNLSNIMFPSDDPFNYPNQPITTLEQNYSMNKGDVYPSQQQQTQQDMFLSMSNDGMRSGTRSPDDHVDAHHFGPVPPYMAQQPRSGERNVNVVGAATSMGLGSGHPQGIHASGADIWNQQARSHGQPSMDLDDIFTDDSWQRREQ